MLFWNPYTIHECLSQRKRILSKMQTDKSFLFHGLTTSVFLIGGLCNLFVQHDSTVLLLYAPLMLFLASVAFFTRNVWLIYALIVATVYPETTAVLQLTTQLFFQRTIEGIAPYTFHAANPLLDFVVSWYHFLLLPLLLHAAYQTRDIFKRSTRLSY